MRPKKTNLEMIPTILLGGTIVGLGIFFIFVNANLLALGIIFIIAGIIVSFIRALDWCAATIILMWIWMIISFSESAGNIIINTLAFLIFMFPIFLSLYFTLSDMFNGNKISDVIMKKINAFSDYIEENPIRSGLFVRPSTKDYFFCFANKYFILKFNLKDFDLLCFKISVTDKTTGKETIFNIINKNSEYRKNFPAETFNNFFKDIFKTIDYDINAEGLISLINRKLKKFTDIKIKTEIKSIKDLYLDINQCSEAELTAIPGVTIAKAKHAIKVRNKQKLFISMNQFYNAINLDEEFIEQIPIKGNKIILNELPEYKRLDIKK